MTADSLEQATKHGTLPESLGWRVFLITAVALFAMAMAAAIWVAIDVLLMVFAAVLLANLIAAPTEWLTRRGLPRGGALALVLVGAFLFALALGSALVPSIASQVPDLTASLSDAITRLRTEIGFSDWAAEISADFNIKSVLPSPAGILGGATGVISSTFGVLADIVILIVLGFYLAASPGLYLNGLVRLVPPAKRGRVRETLVAIGHTLRWWFAGQLVSMTVVGTLTFIGLSILGVPLALVLAVIAFFLTFVPFIGAILAGVPVVLVAFSEGLHVATYAIILYAAIQALEGYVLTPMIQRRSVYLPPALTVVAQVLLGVLLGGLGLMLATPLAAAAQVAVNKLYIEDVLGEAAP